MSSSERPAPQRAAAVGALDDPAGGHRARRRAAVALAGFALAALGALGGCGFRLRGDVSYAFPTLYVSGPPAAPIVIQLKRAIEHGGQAQLVADPAKAQAILEITSITEDKGVLSLSSGGRVREYLLTSRVAFNVHDAAGRDWLPAGEITLRRSYTFSESEVLAREAQEQRLLRDMQTDAVQQIVRRLQAAKRPAA